jgi:hypothetical protein
MHVDLDARVGFKDTQPLQAPQGIGATPAQNATVTVRMSA